MTRRYMRRIVLIGSLILIAITAIFGQARQSKPGFEVASIKPYLASSSNPLDFSGFLSDPGGHFRVAGREPEEIAHVCVSPSRRTKRGRAGVDFICIMGGI